MRTLTQSGQQLIDDIARRHGFSADATATMLDAVVRGNGSMAQFNHGEFAGSGQWMRGGMTMVSDMFNHRLKNRVDALCAELSQLIADQPDLVRRGSFQTQRQGSGDQWQSNQEHAQGDGASQPEDGRSHGSLFVAPTAGKSGDWWPSELRWPNSTGSQNGARYAYFAQARRLAIETGGRVTVYDTLDHQIGGFSQQQSTGGTLTLSSQHGRIDLASLPVVSGDGQGAGAGSTSASNASSVSNASNVAPALQSSAPASDAPSLHPGQDIFATIEKLASLRDKGILSADEFATKKAELLARL